MKGLLLGCLLVLPLCASGAAQGVAGEETVIERPFAEGGAVILSLGSGRYKLRGGASDRIVVRWRVGAEARVSDLRAMAVDVRVEASTATIVTSGPTRHADFIVELPARSDVHVRMRAGDLRVDGIEGNKDIRMAGR